MDSSVGQDRVTEWSSGEGDSSGSRDVPTSISLWSTTPLPDRRRGATVNLIENVSSVTQQRRDYLPFGSVAWSLGHGLIDRHEYGQAAECFRRMLLSAEDSADRLSAEAAEVAVQLCAALSCEQSVEKKLREILRALSQDLSRLSYEEVNFARGALAACVEERFDAARRISTAFAASEATGVTVHAAARSHLRVHLFGASSFYGMAR